MNTRYIATSFGEKLYTIEFWCVPKIISNLMLTLCIIITHIIMYVNGHIKVNRY